MQPYYLAIMSCSTYLTIMYNVCLLCNNHQFPKESLMVFKSIYMETCSSNVIAVNTFLLPQFQEECFSLLNTQNDWEHIPLPSLIPAWQGAWGRSKGSALWKRPEPHPQS